MNQELQKKYLCGNKRSYKLFDLDVESRDLKHLLAQILPLVKSVSILPHTPMGVYKQAPYEKITEEEYNTMSQSIHDVDWNSFREDAIGTRGCDGENCEFPNPKRQKTVVEDAVMTKGCDSEFCAITSYKFQLEDEKKRKRED